MKVTYTEEAVADIVEASRDVRIELRRGGWIAFVEIGDSLLKYLDESIRCAETNCIRASLL